MLFLEKKNIYYEWRISFKCPISDRMKRQTRPNNTDDGVDDDGYNEDTNWSTNNGGNALY